MIIGKILPEKLRHSYYWWKSKQLSWKESIFCDCGLATIPAWNRAPDMKNGKLVFYEKYLTYYNKIDTECDNCHAVDNQYQCIWGEHIFIYCDKCRFEYSSDYIGNPPRGKKYKGEKGVSN